MKPEVLPKSTPMNLSPRVVALVELIAFVAIALITKALLDPYIWRFAGPISLTGTLVLMTVYMRMRGESWRTMGLPRLESTREKLMVLPKALLTLVAFASCVAVVFLGAKALGIEFSDETPPGALDRFGSIHGNLPQLMLWIGIAWTTAAFGEEMFFRGFVITRLLNVFKDVRFAKFFAVLLAALFFGYVHFYYQGMRGFFITGAIGIAFGSMFLVFKRSLWPIILLHGAIDTLGFIATYKGWE